MNDINYLGSIIKDLRKSKALTQKELVEDICSIKQLSRIEANTSSPSAILFTQFSSRLGNSLNEYIPYSDCKTGFLIKKEIEDLMILYHNWDYDLLESRINTSTLIKETTSEYALKEVEWLRCAMKINCNKDRSIDISYYKRILNINGEFDTIFDRFIHPIEYKFLNALICLYNFNKDYESSKHLLIKSIQNYENYYTNITDSYYIRLNSNLAKIYYKCEAYETAIEVAEKGITHCFTINDSAYLCDLYLTSGEAYHALGNIKTGKEHLYNYISLRNINKPNSLLNYENTIVEIREKYNLNANS